ncbi:MAG: hypothetical protein ACTSYC_06810 [Promethearchaeota archaeon]
MSAKINIIEIIDALSNVEGVMGFLILNKFGTINHDALPDWVNRDKMLDFLNSLLTVSNEIFQELRQGKIIKMGIESADANFLISIIRGYIIAIITQKDLKIKFFEDKSKVLILKNLNR